MNLQKNMALGDARHRRQVRDLFEDIRQSLADCVLAYAAQSGLPKADTVRLVEHLSRVKTGDTDAGGAIENSTLTLLMALFYAVDISALQKVRRLRTVLNLSLHLKLLLFSQCEDGESAVENLPLLKDPSFIPTLHRELGPHSPRQWGSPKVKSAAHFAWAMTVAGLRALPHNQAAQAVVEDDEVVMDLALDDRVFHHLPPFVLANRALRTEEFYLRRLHQMLTDFVVLMPLKVKELRNRADDAARNNMMHEHEGIQYTVPLAGQHFEHLLRSIAALYESDDLKLGLAMDYWCPPDISSGLAERCPQRQVSLYKFVRLAGDLLMPSLYVPYLNLLVSLSGHPQAALHCFNLLKLNGLSGGHQQGANTISWDHFFGSLQQYFSNLRQEQQHPHQKMLPVTDTIYYHGGGRPLTRGISPSEIQGLVSVLRLVRAVADNCEAARVAIAENSAWQPLLVVVGLLGCPVPPELKAELLRTLASLARSPEVAHVVWQNVESAQLITTGSLPSSSAPARGLGVELENVETRNEEYPMSRAFLHLLDVLTDSSIPGTLGGGSRQPGFEPYLAYVRDAIFLRFNARAYRDPSEKWELVAACLRLLSKVVSEYVPAPADFAKVSQSEPTPAVGKHPGFFVLLDLFQTSELLRLVLFVVDEGCAILETYQQFPGKEHLEKSCLLALRLLDTALGLERSFMEAARVANTPLLLTALSQLLQGVNPRSGRPDHMLNVAKFVTFAWWLPSAALHSVKILSAVSDSPGSQPGLLATLNGSKTVGQNIIKGFTDIMDSDEEEEDGNQSDENHASRTMAAARIEVVKLLLNGLDKPAPSLSHFLLGFDLKVPLARSNLQPPGVLGSIRTPFHAILSFLKPVSPRVPSPAIQRSPHLCEASYRLVYYLSANVQTSEVTLRYLRSSEDFLTTQLSLLPLPDELSSSVQIVKGVSWLLQTVAIELKSVSAARLRSQVSLLIRLLLESEGAGGLGAVNGSEESFLGATTAAEEAALSQLSRSALAPAARGGGVFLSGTAVSATAASLSHIQSGPKQQHRLLQMLNSIDFEESSLSAPAWEVFDSSQVGQVLKTCERKGPQGEKTIDVQKLHKILNDELSSLQGSAALNQRQIIQEEIKRYIFKIFFQCYLFSYIN